MRQLAALAAILPLLAQAAGRVDIIEGNPASPVKVTIYEDLASPECARLRLMLDEKVLPKYGRRIAFVHRDFPLPRHDWARPAAIAARWMFEQSSAMGMLFRRELLAEQEHITAAGLPDWVRAFAKRYKMDEAGAVAALNDARFRSMVDSDIQGGSGRGVSKLPAVYLGTQSFTENVLFEDLARAMDAALEK